MFFKKENLSDLSQLFSEKNYSAIIKSYSIDKNISKHNWKKNLYIAKSYIQIGNYQSSLNILINIDKYIEFHEVKFLIGIIYKKLNQISGSLEYLHRAFELNNEIATYSNELGLIYLNNSKYDLALKFFYKALELNNPFKIKVIINYNIAFAYQKLNKFKDSIKYNLKSIEIDKNFIPALESLGICYYQLKKFDISKKYFLEALNINPNHSNILNNLSVLSLEIGDTKFALKYIDKFLSLYPSNSLGYLNKAKILKSELRLNESLDFFIKAIKFDNTNYEAISNYLITLNYMDNLDEKFIIDEHYKYSSFFIKKETSYKKNFSNNFDKIKLAFFSGDFKKHAVMEFFLPFIENLDEDRFGIYCFSNSIHKHDEYTEIIKKKSNFIEIFNKNDEEVIQIINYYQINILIDLSGHTKHNRLSLFSKKPCRHQISWIGYPNTTGLRELDYRIADYFTDPIDIDNKSDHLEKIIRLKNFFMIYKPPKHFKILPPPALTKKYITFGSFNNPFKISNTTISLWSVILTSVVNSKLILKNYAYKNYVLKNNLLKKFQSFGVNESRIEFYEKLPVDDHYNFYNYVDIALDPTPYNGTTTSLDSLWMGVPTICLEGNSHRSRVTHSILNNIGCPELSSLNQKDYIKKTIELSEDLEKIQYYKKNLRNKIVESPLVDYKSFIDEITNVFKNIIQ